MLNGISVTDTVAMLLVRLGKYTAVIIAKILQKFLRISNINIETLGSANINGQGDNPTSMDQDASTSCV